MSRVLVVIPAYNECETIAKVVESIRTLTPGYEIVVVDDGSTDDTAAIARRAGANLIRLPYNMGIGSTMQTGYRYALQEGYDIAVQEGKGDLVIGSRYVTDTDYHPSFSRRVGKSILSRLVNSVTGGGITDTTSGFRAMNREVIALFAHHYPDDYPEAEALVTIYKSGLKAVEIPVDMLQRQGGVSSIGPRRAAYYIVKVSLAIFIGVFKKITRAPEQPGPGNEAKRKQEGAS